MDIEWQEVYLELTKVMEIFCILMRVWVTLGYDLCLLVFVNFI